MKSHRGAQSARHERVASLLHKEFALLLQQGTLPLSVKSFLSVVHVQVEPCLSVARIYIGDFDRGNIDTVVSELNEQAAYCRHLLAGRVELRRMPQLKFFADSELHRAWQVVAPQ